MEANNLAIIIAYYFSKFDKQGMRNLGYQTESEAFQDVADRLGIKKNYVKFRRDEFDPVHPWREGWKRPMALRIMRAIEALSDLSELNLREIVINILNSKEYRNSEEIHRITSLFSFKSKVDKKDQNYIVRGPTGKKAEEFFIRYYAETFLPVSGDLIDTRDLGTGYDFEIKTVDEIYYIEVKGLAAEEGGMLFTNKEWETAKEKGDKYIIVLISNLKGDASIKFIWNPYEKIKPKKNIVTTIQVQWSISNNQIPND